MRHLALLAVCFATLATAARADEDADVKALWKEKNCAKCHAVDGTGQTPMGKKNHSPNFTRARWQTRHSDEVIKKAIVEGVVEDGKRKMPAFGNKLDAGQIDSLVAYVRAFGKDAKAEAPKADAKADAKTETKSETKTGTSTESTTELKPEAAPEKPAE